MTLLLPRRRLLPLVLLVALSSILVPHSCHGFSVVIDDNGEPEVQVISYPHSNNGDGDSPATTTHSLDGFLEPYYLITAPMVTQPDTFQELSTTKIMSVDVPVYRMKQPERLSAAQLSFQLVLVRELGHTARGLVQEVPVDMQQAKDSWFPGFYWTPIIAPLSSTVDDEQQWQHVGWKFTALGHDGNGLAYFYALMVNIEEKERNQGVRVGGFKAPGWMVARVLTQ